MDKVSKYGQDVRQGLISGVNKLVNPVKITLGAKGKLVGIYDSRMGAHVTKDGYTIAKNIRVDSDKLEALSIDLVNQAIAKTNEVVGDATTTTAIMCQTLITEGLNSISVGSNPLKLKLGLDEALKFATTRIKELSTPVDNRIPEIAKISGNNSDFIGNTIGKAFGSAGTHENSSIKVIETTDNETTVDIIKGYKLEKGFLRDAFINHPSGNKCVYKNPYILMIHSELKSFRDFLPILGEIAKEGRPLVIIANRFDGEFLNSLTITLDRQLQHLQALKEKGEGGYFQQIGVVQNPMAMRSADELYGDMGVVCGSKISHLNVRTEDINIKDLGSADEVIINRSNTLIIGGHGDDKKVEEKITLLKAQKKGDKEINDFEKSVLKKRIESLSGTHASIRVGGQSEAEIKELKDLFDDALNAVRASIKEGILPGGGSTLLRIADEMRNPDINDQEVLTGWNIFIKALEAPFYQVMMNANEPKDVIKYKILKSKKKNVGYNVLTEQYVDMIREGIIDPAMAERVSLENAVAVASLMYNMDGVVLEDLS